MSANMDTVGTPAMHKVLSKYKLITCPARHFLNKGIDKFNKGESNICWFGGIEDITKLSKTTTGFIGLDVANGYTIRFVDAVKKLRDKCPEATIAEGMVTVIHKNQFLQELISQLELVLVRFALQESNWNWLPQLSGDRVCYGL